MLRVRATPTLGNTGLALGSPPRKYQKAACHGSTITSDQGYRWARGQGEDKPGIQEAYRARKTNEMVNTPGKGPTTCSQVAQDQITKHRNPQHQPGGPAPGDGKSPRKLTLSLFPRRVSPLSLRTPSRDQFVTGIYYLTKMYLALFYVRHYFKSFVHVNSFNTITI